MNQEPQHERSGYERQVLALLREISTKLDSIRLQLAGLADPRRRKDASPLAGGASSSKVSEDWESLPTETLESRLRDAREEGEYHDVLDIRRILVDRVDHEDRARLDRELAVWFTRDFHRALRSGNAMGVAGALERAVEELGDIPEMSLLAESLPTVLRGVGLYLDAKAADPSRDEPT